MITTLDSCGIIVRSETLALARLVDIDGRGRQGILAFEQTVHWLRDVGPKVSFEHGGINLKNASGFCDVGQYMTSLDSAIEEARLLCRRYSVDRASSLSIVVDVVVSETPVLTSEEAAQRAYFGRRSYEPVPKDWLLHQPERINACLRARIENMPYPEGGMPVLTDAKVADVRVWSSALLDADNQSALDQFKITWAARS